ncbi:unnamed protein product [Closterium sp. NIES-65]|nr:unnamed protein product [Closterium sp. NIES-65]
MGRDGVSAGDARRKGNEHGEEEGGRKGHGAMGRRHGVAAAWAWGGGMGWRHGVAAWGGGMGGGRGAAGTVQRSGGTVQRSGGTVQRSGGTVQRSGGTVQRSGGTVQRSGGTAQGRAAGGSHLSRRSAASSMVVVASALCSCASSHRPTSSCPVACRGGWGHGRVRAWRVRAWAGGCMGEAGKGNEVSGARAADRAMAERRSKKEGRAGVKCSRRGAVPQFPWRAWEVKERARRAERSTGRKRRSAERSASRASSGSAESRNPRRNAAAPRMAPLREAVPPARSANGGVEEREVVGGSARSSGAGTKRAAAEKRRDRREGLSWGDERREEHESDLAEEEPQRKAEDR